MIALAGFSRAGATSADVPSTIGDSVPVADSARATVTGIDTAEMPTSDSRASFARLIQRFSAMS